MYIGGCSKERRRQETGDRARLTSADIAVQDASCVEVRKAERHLPGRQQNCPPARRRLLGGRLPEAALVHSILCQRSRRRIKAVPANARLISKSPVPYKDNPEPKITPQTSKYGDKQAVCWCRLLGNRSETLSPSIWWQILSCSAYRREARLCRKCSHCSCEPIRCMSFSHSDSPRESPRRSIPG